MKQGDYLPPFETHLAKVFNKAYLVFPSGQIFSFYFNNGRLGKQIKHYKGNFGYASVTLKRPDGKRKTYTVHRILASLFLGPKPSPKHQVRHLDGNSMNSCVVNLCWGTPKENGADRIKHKKPIKRCPPGTKKWHRHAAPHILEGAGEGEG